MTISYWSPPGVKSCLNIRFLIF